MSESIPCSIEGCDRQRKTRGWCGMHYSRWKTHGDPGPAASYKSHKNDSIEERIARRGFTVTESGCWEWNGTVIANGYGIFAIRSHGVKYYVHRVMWELHNGQSIPDGMFVCHTCDNRSCGNPDHLFLGTLQDNVDDMTAKGRQARGVTNGHAKLTEADVVEIRRLCAGGETQRSVASKFGVCQQTVSRLMVGGRYQNWRHVS